MTDEKEQQFNSPSRGRIAFSEVIYSLVDYMEEDPKKKYHLIIGTDSRTNGHNNTSHKIDLVTAIVIHRLGKGGRYFWRKETKESVHTLRQKIYEETNSSLAIAQQLLNTLNKYLISARGNPIPKPPKYELEIHVDIGQAGPTREMIKEIVGMVQGYGFNAKTKPEAYAASKVADKHT
jgi:predicted RNase H-related nuclease YkuK (DUF458 family)